MKGFFKAIKKRLRKQSQSLCRALFFGLIFHTLLLPANSWAAVQDEYRVKAAFIYNFIAFTQWPDSSMESIHTCIYGEEDFGHEIDALQHRTVNDRSITVLRIMRYSELNNCQVLFISQLQIANLTEILAYLQKAPVLTIADSTKAAAKGIMINMHLKQNRVKFEINLKSARDAGLNISSRLLQLATRVYQ